MDKGPKSCNGEIEMTTFDFDDGKGPVPAHKHPNGGGWVADTAKVAKTAYVGAEARVYGNAMVFGNARVYGDARVYDNAGVYDNAKVYGNAKDFDTSEDIFIEMNGKRYKLVEIV